MSYVKIKDCDKIIKINKLQYAIKNCVHNFQLKVLKIQH